MNSSELHQKRVTDVSGRITEQGLISSSTRLFPIGCVLIGLAGQGKTRGTVAINSVPLCTNQSIAAILPNPIFDSEYLYYSLHLRYDELRELSSGGGGRGALNLTILRSVVTPLPRIEEQRAIAKVLRDIDALLDAIDLLIAKKRNLKQAVMQQLLTGRTRLPGFSGEWKLKRLGDMLKVCYGKSQRGVADGDGSYPVLGSGGRIGSAIRPLYDKPSVLIGRKGTIDLPQYMDTPFWTVDTLFYTTMKSQNCAKFLYYRFCLIQWSRYNEASGVPSLSAQTIENIEFECPEPFEQTAISSVLSDMDTEIEALEARLDKTQDLKQAMMQELLTGKTRLVKAEIAGV